MQEYCLCKGISHQNMAFYGTGTSLFRYCTCNGSPTTWGARHRSEKTTPVEILTYIHQVTASKKKPMWPCKMSMFKVGESWNGYVFWRLLNDSVHIGAGRPPQVLHHADSHVPCGNISWWKDPKNRCCQGQNLRNHGFYRKPLLFTLLFNTIFYHYISLYHIYIEFFL